MQSSLHTHHKEQSGQWTFWGLCSPLLHTVHLHCHPPPESHLPHEALHPQTPPLNHDIFSDSIKMLPQFYCWVTDPGDMIIIIVTLISCVVVLLQSCCSCVCLIRSSDIFAIFQISTKKFPSLQWLCQRCRYVASAVSNDVAEIVNNNQMLLTESATFQREAGIEEL